MNQLVVQDVERALLASAGDFRHGGHGPDKLLPVAALERALTTDMAGCGKLAANRLVVFYIKSRASLRVQDPEVYAAIFETILARYPEEIARKAVDYLIETREWPPEAAHIVAACERFMVPRRAMVWVARRQLEEHERRRQEAEHEAAVERDRPVVEAEFREWKAGFKRTVEGKRIEGAYAQGNLFIEPPNPAEQMELPEAEAGEAAG